MEFTIYTTGSAEFLEIMLNACAMITGSGDAEGLARIGALLGLFLLAFQAVFNNQAITFGKAGLMLALYMMFYGPTATADSTLTRTPIPRTSGQ
ncbi:conjugal transfer protein TraG N-terminal domain-containing protein [Pseudomonas aeruginosa]|uniref:conjugal transfer protein TraG N-terminal domain-containing protein n=1 Tax=Pseudomonas aeruginosa TaxID=287 RepID=UPI00295F19FD|nr:conjugal transfer protein TraG N-terminal domain-containing protein [Pseudomonas aeruginosa]